MNFVLIIFIIVSILLIILLLKKAKNKIAILVVGFIFVVLGYLLFPEIESFYKFNFHSISRHTYVVENVSKELFLPEKTIFQFRFSDTGATYLTQKIKDDVINFYNDKVEEISVSTNNDNITIVSFKYNEEHFIIQIKETNNSKYCYLTIDCDSTAKVYD